MAIGFLHKLLNWRSIALAGIFLITTGCDQIPLSPPISPPQPTASANLQNPLLAPTDTPFPPTASPTAWEPIPPSPTQSKDIPTPHIPAQISPTPTSNPTLTPTTAPSAGQLTYLQGGDVWIVDIPSGSPKQLTHSGDILSYSWAHDGSLLVIFNGRILCSLTPEGVQPGCIDLGLSGQNATIPRQIAWSPDQNTLVLWNATNPWDEDAIGWIVVQANSREQPWLVFDPVDWGASLAPENQAGGITGQALFLPEGTLVGTVTHRWLCGAAGCHYKLYYLDVGKRSLIPYPNRPEDGFSEGAGLALSQDGRKIVNYGTFQSDCNQYDSFVDRYSLDTEERDIYHLPQQAIQGMTLSFDAQSAVISLSGVCTVEEQINWAQMCGLSQGHAIHAMQYWNFLEDQRRDLPPGTQPDLSPGGELLAFRSCITDQTWEPNGQLLASIYILELATNRIYQIVPGSQPQWRPIPHQ